MVATHKTVKVTSESSVDELLAGADDQPVLFERNGAIYRLSREGSRRNIWEGYAPDPDDIDRMLDEVAGSWGDLNTDKLIADLHEAREKGSRPADRFR
jgi:hypothetical protein